MTTIAKLKLIANCGDPDAAPAVRIDLVAAAMKVLEASDNARRKRLDDFASTALVDEAIVDMLIMARRYRNAVRKRARA